MPKNMTNEAVRETIAVAFERRGADASAHKRVARLPLQEDGMQADTASPKPPSRQTQAHLLIKRVHGAFMGFPLDSWKGCRIQSPSLDCGLEVVVSGRRPISLPLARFVRLVAGAVF